MKKFLHIWMILATLMLLVSHSLDAQLDCKSPVNVEAEEDGMITIPIETFLNGIPPATGLEIELINVSDFTDRVNGVDLVSFQLFQNKEFDFSITNPVNSEVCTGQIFVQSYACVDTMRIEFVPDVGLDNVSVDVRSLSTQSIESLQWQISYDPSILRYSDITSNELNALGFINSFDAAGIITITWFDLTGANPAELEVNDNVMTLEFDIIDDGISEIGLKENPTVSAEIIDNTGDYLCLESTSASFNTNGAVVSGKVVRNEDFSCGSGNILPLENWLIKIDNGNATFYTTSNEDGNYGRVVPPGNYTVTVLPPSYLWQICTNNIDISLPTVDDKVELEFKGWADEFCADLNLGISTPFIRRCFENQYTINYCNEGTITATNAVIEVELDPKLDLVSSTAAYTINGQYILFDIGDVEVGCQTIDFIVMASCEAELGETHCVAATMTADENCGDALLDWNGSIIDVNAVCENDSVRFTITNIGLDMLASAPFIVVEDDVMIVTGDFNLESSESVEKVFESNGNTFRLNAMQQNGFPYNEVATDFSEGCGTNENGEISLGYVNNLHLADDEPYVDLDCQMSIGSFDPNDKASFPEGYGDEHYTKNNQTINYKIRFQNTGTDTAFRVVVIDTISTFLNMEGFRKGSSSHDYTLQIKDNILKYTFDNIMLVDSTTNESASHGFVSFQIDMIADLADGIIINNSADIYFDYNDPITTNQTFLEIGTDFIEEASLTTIDNPTNIDVRIIPNPASRNSVIYFEDQDQSQKQIQIFNIIGKEVLNEKLNGNVFDLAHSNLVKGTYVVRLVNANDLVFSGKLIVH